MKYAVLLLLMCGAARADWIDVEELSIDYVKYFDGGRMPLVSSNGLPNKEPSVRLGLNLTLALPATFYWANRIESYADRDMIVGDGQFRTVGWQVEVGTRVIPKLDIFYFHHSQHILDHEYQFGYPVEDGLGFRIKVISK